MSELGDLYQQMILDHSKRPRHFHVMDDATSHAEGYNPLCGDRVTIYLKLTDSHFDQISFTGTACAICTASASLMTQMLAGTDAAKADEMFDRMRQMLTGPEDQALDEDALGKLVVLHGVRKYPMRVKCATLPWHTMKAALNGGDGGAPASGSEGANQAVTTE